MRTAIKLNDRQAATSRRAHIDRSPTRHATSRRPSRRQQPATRHSDDRAQLAVLVTVRRVVGISFTYAPSAPRPSALSSVCAAARRPGTEARRPQSTRFARRQRNKNMSSFRLLLLSVQRQRYASSHRMTAADAAGAESIAAATLTDIQACCFDHLARRHSLPCAVSRLVWNNNACASLTDWLIH